MIVNWYVFFREITLVRFVIMLLIFVFDPLAVCLIIAANISLMRIFGKDGDRPMPGALRGFAEPQEKDKVIDDFFREDFNDDEVKKKTESRSKNSN